MDDLHTGGSYAFQGEPGNHCVGEYGEIRAVHVGKGIRAEDGLALFPTRQDVLDRTSALAFLHAAVWIFKSWNSGRSRSLKHGRRNSCRWSKNPTANKSSG